MPGYYQLGGRDPVPMAQVYPPARSCSLAKLNYTKEYSSIYDHMYRNPEKSKSERRGGFFDKLRRQKSCEGDALYPGMMYHSQTRRPELGFDSLQLLGSKSDDRYLDRFMDPSRSRPLYRDNEITKNKNTLVSNKSSNSKSSSNSGNSSSNKENKSKSSNSLTLDILTYVGSLKYSPDNIYESVEQIQYRKSLENKNRQEKVRSVHRTGHPLFDHLREERAIAGGTKPEAPAKPSGKTLSRSAGPSRKTSVQNSPNHSSPSSGDELDLPYRRHSTVVSPERSMTLQHRPQRSYQKQEGSSPPWRRTASAGSESDDDWIIPRPKIAAKRRGDPRTCSTDESDSSSKSGPIR